MKILIKQTVHVDTLDVSADEWQLFTHTLDHKEASDAAATLLNTIIVETVNNGQSREEVYVNTQEVMYSVSNTGASDTEPQHVLGDILDTIFGKE
jgi:hypothetical protein